MPRVRSKYQSNSGGIYKISLDSAKIAVTGNSAPTGAITDPNVEVEVSEYGNRRKGGIHPRGVTGSRTGTGADLNKVFRVFIPCLTPDSQTAVLVGDTFSYKGQTYNNLVPIPES